ncbi:hypothetical protein FO519_009203 [Halicephalobus sp. NKZ332]|nr:hypothetical protein FO519_009203 [Halicephalobus sp. NKZ332]
MKIALREYTSRNYSTAVGNEINSDHHQTYQQSYFYNYNSDNTNMPEMNVCNYQEVSQYHEGNFSPQTTGVFSNDNRFSDHQAIQYQGRYNVQPHPVVHNNISDFNNYRIYFPPYQGKYPSNSYPTSMPVNSQPMDNEYTCNGSPFEDTFQNEEMQQLKTENKKGRGRPKNQNPSDGAMATRKSREKKRKYDSQLEEAASDFCQYKKGRKSIRPEILRFMERLDKSLQNRRPLSEGRRGRGKPMNKTVSPEALSSREYNEKKKNYREKLERAVVAFYRNYIKNTAVDDETLMFMREVAEKYQSNPSTVP